MNKAADIAFVEDVANLEDKEMYQYKLVLNRSQPCVPMTKEDL